MNLVDSSGWLEYFAGSKNSDFFTLAIEDVSNLIVSTINLYEVFKKILQQRDETDALQAVSLMQQGKIIEIDSTISLNAAKMSYDLKLPMADSLILATAKMHDAILWTQDSDFEKIPNVKFIKK